MYAAVASVMTDCVSRVETRASHDLGGDIMPIKLLLADDSVVIQKLVGLSFANEDIEIITVDNGDEAVSQAASSKPDIVLADVVMPGKNGYEVCSDIRGNAELANTPVLLLTGTFEAFDEGRAAEVGATGHITKPFEAQALVDRVNEILASQPGTSEAPVAANTGSDFFDQNTGELGVEGAGEQTNPLAAPPASPEAPTVAQDFVFGESDPMTGEPMPASHVQGAEIDDGLGEEIPAPAHDDPMGGDHTVAIMPDTDLPVGQSWGENAGDVPAPTYQADPVPAAPIEPPPTANPDQTMLIDDFLGAESPDPMPAAPETDPDAQSGAAIGSVDLTSMPAPNPLDSVDPMEPLAGGDDLDLDGLSFDDAAPLDSNAGLSAPSMSGDETVIADDLFSDGTDLSSPLDAPTNPAPPPSPSSSQGLDIDFGAPEAAESVVPDNASDYDVSASDLQVDPLASDSSWGSGVPAGVVTGPDPITPPHAPEHDVAAPPAPEPSATPDLDGDSSPGLDADWNAPAAGSEPSAYSQPSADSQSSAEPQPEPTPTPEPPVDFGATQDAAPPEPAPSVDPTPSAAATPSSSSDLSPDMRDRIHDTLEKVAWEAFSDLSDDLVKQLVDKVEQIAWEVIPQMAETLIREEIRKMKGEEGEDA